MERMIRWVVLLAVATAGGAVAVEPPALSAAAGPTVSLAVPPSPTLAAPASATLAEAPEDSGTVSEELRMGGAQIQVRRVSYATSEQRLSFVVPDGDASMVVEQRIRASAVRMGMHYNFFNGTVQAWVTYVLPLVDERLKLQVSASDDIGLGTVYLGRTYLERAQSIPVGLAWMSPLGPTLVSVGRTKWRLAALDSPMAAPRRNIDALDLTLQATALFPNLLALRRPELVLFTFRHAFRGLGGDDKFDRADLTVHWRNPGVRARDEWEVRFLDGQAFSISKAASLPLREQYVMGGATSLRGYGFREFLGSGILQLGAEYDLGVPLVFSRSWMPFDLTGGAFLAFLDAGRIQDDWTDASRPLHWSGGLGARITGRLLKGHPLSMRVYEAQAAERGRRPVFYFLVDIQ